jgi:dTDP-4-amino-4,6-dideoxygalactose transaminase
VMKNVPFFNYPHVYESQKQKFDEIFSRVSSNGAFIMQRELEEFERDLAAYCGAKYAVGVANATDGLQMLLMASGIHEGDEIIFCSHTMVATASAIHFAGAIPVPVEAGEDHLIDFESIEAAITSRTRGIMPTQLNGRTCDMDRISDIADRNDLLVFEDSAQALGSRFKGQHAGTFGKGGCISFYPAKVLGCLGDGGAVITNDEEVYRDLLLLRDHGRGEDGDIHLWGLNSRLDNLQAAFLDFQLDDYPKVIERRREIASLYDHGLSGLEQLKLPPAPKADANHFDIYQNFEIEADSRDALQSHLRDCGIGTLIQWGGKAVHQFPKLGFSQELPFTEDLFKRMLMLPLNMSMTDSDVEHVIDSIKVFYE